MCENRVTSMAFESMSFAFHMVVTACDSVSTLVGLENKRIFLEDNITFDEKYQLFEEIGKGRFGLVYRGGLKPDGEYVAVKVTNRLIVGKNDEKLILQEHKILRRLNHPNIIKCYDFFEESSMFYCVLEYVAGGDLFTRLLSCQHFSEKNIRDIFESLLSAIEYCHDRNIIHRDLKLENLLVSHKSAPIESVKIADFGFAIDVSDYPLGLVEGYVGSPAYLAPEIILTKPYGKAVDMWALGVVLYAMFSGRMPFAAKDSVTLRRSIRTANVLFLGEVWANVSSEAKNLIKRLLCVDSNERLTAHKALSHPWLRLQDGIISGNRISTANIRKYLARRRFQLISKAIIAYSKLVHHQKIRSHHAHATHNHQPLEFHHTHSQPENTVSNTSPRNPSQTASNHLFISDDMREKVLSTLSDVDADEDDASFYEKYSLFEDQELGKGAFAVVCRGALNRNGIHVAIKLVDRTSLTPNTEDVMKEEAEMLRLLCHPHVIRCFDFYKEPTRFIIVMELVEGGDLLTRLARKTIYSEKDARDLVEILLSAVNHCHEHNIVHRDLKLDNLLLVNDRDDNKIKLADFGLATKADGMSLNGFCGTPGYVAPEVLNLQCYGKPVDIWSTGVMVFALLGGYLPFDAESLHRYKVAVTKPLEFDPDFWGEVSHEAKDLIRKLLDINVSTRYTAAQALRHPWLLRSGSVLARRPLPKTLSKLKETNLRRKFKVIAHSLIAQAKFMRALWAPAPKLNTSKAAAVAETKAALERLQLQTVYETDSAPNSESHDSVHHHPAIPHHHIAHSEHIVLHASLVAHESHSHEPPMVASSSQVPVEHNKVHVEPLLLNELPVVIVSPKGSDGSGSARSVESATPTMNKKKVSFTDNLIMEDPIAALAVAPELLSAATSFLSQDSDEDEPKAQPVNSNGTAALLPPPPAVVPITPQTAQAPPSEASSAAARGPPPPSTQAVRVSVTPDSSGSPSSLNRSPPPSPSRSPCTIPSLKDSVMGALTKSATGDSDIFQLSNSDNPSGPVSAGNIDSVTDTSKKSAQFSLIVTESASPAIANSLQPPPKSELSPRRVASNNRDTNLNVNTAAPIDHTAFRNGNNIDPFLLSPLSERSGLETVPSESEIVQKYPLVQKTSSGRLLSMNVMDPNDPEAHLFRNMYVLQGHLGHGSFGTVFKACRRDDVHVKRAVKIINRLVLSPAEDARVLEEAHILQSLKHPSIISFVEFFEEAKVFIMVMEYLDGGELFYRIVKKVYYNEETARNLIRELLQAVKHMHDKLVVHRDIKPENIMLASMNSDDKIKVIDFGCAALLHSPDQMLEGFSGTLAYAAPEMVEFQPYGKSVDMWSVGVLAFILLGGYSPFDTKNTLRLRHQIRTADFEFDENCFNDVSGDAKNFISKLIVVDVNKRLTVDQALNHPWMKRNDLKHRVLATSSAELSKFNLRRRFQIISRLIIAKSKFEKKKKLATCLSTNALVKEAMHLTFTDLYDLREVLGKGGFATVYHGVQKRNEESVAVKVIDRRNMSQVEQESLQQERQILQKLSHPHIIKCIDVFEEPSTFFIVMELITGGELFERIVKKTTYSEDEARTVVSILLGAIKHCHDYHVVHRDLKPENLLLENEIDDNKIKLIDFGLAGIAEGCTLEGYCGSLGYMAPEILQLMPHGKPVDMWSIGVIAYVLLSGYLPFEAGTRLQYKKNILRGKLEFHADFWVGVSAEAKDLISKLLSVDPALRPNAGQAMRHPWFKASALVLRSHSLQHSITQLKKFNAHRKFRSVAHLLVAKAKFEAVMLGARQATRGESMNLELADLTFRDRYEILDELGRGGFGTVFRAKPIPLPSRKSTTTHAAPSTVAVKVIKRKDMTKKHEQSVRDEAEILLSLNHPHIIKCYDLFEDPSTFFIVMEVMDGGELFDRIVKKVFYTEKEARDVVRKLLSAIKHCHDHDIVHRDLKPENLLLAGRDNDEDIKLIDFGLSGRASGETLTGYVGTPGYTAPELFEHKPHGKPVDMWAVGVIAYVLLGGYLPFKATPRAKYQQMARRGRIEFHPEYWGEISAEAKDLITNLMRVRVEKRYTVEHALMHPWLKANPVLLRKTSLARSMQSLRHFNAARKFRIVAKLIIAQSKFIMKCKKAKPTAEPVFTENVSFPEKYELCEVIGKGGFGTVYRATQKKTAAVSRFGMFVAVKWVDRTSMSKFDEDNIRREYTILQSLSHSHIIRCLDVFEEPSTFFIVMELVEGGELFARLVKKTSYSEKEARDLVEILLKTIKHCHDHDVVHRDLKPENLLLVSPVYNHEIKLIDFGLAGIAAENTLEGYCGSIGYMAPEIIELKPHGKPVDMWAIGVIAFVLLCGYLPFEAASRQLYKKQVLKGKLSFPDEYWSAVSPEAKDLITKLLVYDMDTRITAVDALKHQWITESGALLKGHDLQHGLDQLKKFNARRKFRSVVNLLIAKGKFERFISAARLSRLQVSQEELSEASYHHGSEPTTPNTPTTPTIRL